MRVDLPLQLDRRSSQSLHLQLTAQLRQAMLSGLLLAGTRLPSTRMLSGMLGVSRNVALAAYDELFAEGYTETRHGSGTFVVADLPVLPRPRPEPSISNPRWLKPARHVDVPDPPHVPGTIDFRLGQPSLVPLPARVWQQLWRDVAMEDRPTYYGPTAGYDDFRAAIAGYLGRSRGISCRAEDVVVCSGAVQALDLVARATLSPGDEIGLEEPGYPTARSVMLAQGARIVPAPIDDDGLRVDFLPVGDRAPLLVYVTPSHQYPTGARLSVSRRLALLEWANQHDSLIIEDDYDSEFRFDAAPLPALAGLDDSGRVVYIGTFSKMLTPALRVGYVVATPLLRDRIVELKRATDRHSPWPAQRVLTRFIQSGRLESHIGKMRRHYAHNRLCLAEALAPLGELAGLRGLEAGLHVYLELRRDLDAERVVARARERGVVISSIAGYFHATLDRNGVLLGYGGLTPEEITAGARILVDVIRDEAIRGERKCLTPPPSA